MISLLLIPLFLSLTPKNENVSVHIPTSELVRVAQIIARNEGYDISDHNIYYFDTLDTLGKPLLKGYASIGFYVNGNIRSSISISETTGQAVDVSTCEIFDYPELKPFQQKMTRLSKAKMRTPQELAEDAGCSPPRVLIKGNPISK